ncbi:MAG: Hsp20/alpha crystallin family protein [Planctomycetes bacterium]|nr:Hsp20/alpha crystallin family protein [Planctomycetota bacterium]
MVLDDYGRDWAWKINVDDRDDCFVLRADAPGFEASDFDVRICGDRLILQANHKGEKKEKGDAYQECKCCYESMTLPIGVDADKIDAKYQDGVLTVTLPKNSEGRGKKIEVKKQ